MNNLIKEFYTHQNEIIKQLNTIHNYFNGKVVNITITHHNFITENKIKRVIFKGYKNKGGFIHINWKNINANGNESKVGGSHVLFDTDSVSITNYIEETEC